MSLPVRGEEFGLKIGNKTGQDYAAVNGDRGRANPAPRSSDILLLCNSGAGAVAALRSGFLAYRLAVLLHGGLRFNGRRGGCALRCGHGRFSGRGLRGESQRQAGCRQGDG